MCQHSDALKSMSTIPTLFGNASNGGWAPLRRRKFLVLRSNGVLTVSNGVKDQYQPLNFSLQLNSVSPTADQTPISCVSVETQFGFFCSIDHEYTSTSNSTFLDFSNSTLLAKFWLFPVSLMYSEWIWMESG
ncbi:hypothetical protein RJT34_31350 [Clitoria ternatea]|uniref:Uncharacterized protein n=1 Tax=Clitoria ternatea TaxID=43366 RepID=A0AAN9I198_CLITE